ncbi:MAG: TonB-dependent receptor domain-containing protein, partial [Acidobacteriota bacterium]
VFNGAGKTFISQRTATVSQSRPSVLEGNSTVASARINNSFQLDDTLSWFKPTGSGDHDLRFGTNLAYRTEKANRASNANGQFVFDTDRPFDATDPTTFPVSFTAKAFGPETLAGLETDITVGLFIQDDWQPVDNLTINLGLRWDRESITEDNDNYGPRVGVEWDPTGSGKTVVRGGFGQFYNRFQFGFFDLTVRDSPIRESGFTLRTPDAGSDQQLFIDLAAANGITDINALRDAVIALQEAGAGSAFNAFPTAKNRNRRQDYAYTTTLGVEHEFFPAFSLGVDYVHTENENMVFAIDANPFSSSLGGRPGISILNGEVRPDFGSIRLFVNPDHVGSSYNALEIHANKRWGNTPIGAFSGKISYTFSDQQGNADARTNFGPRFQRRTESGFNFDTGEIIGEPFDLDLDNPQNVNRPSPWLRNHNFVASGAYLIPGTSYRDNGGLMLSGIWRWMSGDRFTPLLFDRLDNGNRAIAPAGTLSANTASDIALDSFPFAGTENNAERPSFKQLDLSLRYAVPFAAASGNTPMRAWFLLDCFNCTSRTNFTSIGSSFAPSSSFLLPNRANFARTWQWGLKLEF